MRKATATKKTAPKKTARKSTAAKSASSARKTTARKTTARKAITRKPAGRRAASGRSTSSRRPTAARTDESAAALSALREHLTRGVMLTGERLQETLNDTVRRGRITRDDADDLLASLISIGRKQTEDVLADLEQLIGSGPSDAAAAARVAGKRARARVEVTAARARHSEPADRVLREVDRARRAAGLGPSFPVMGYDELSAAQISSRLTSLTSAQVRKVRDYERRHANRKSVLNEIEKRLK